jgi:hypothetical protein
MSAIKGKKGNKVLKGSKNPRKETKKAMIAARKMKTEGVIDTIKALQHLTPDQVTCVQTAMRGLHQPNDISCDASTELQDHFGLLKEAGLVKGPMFSRTTGLPKLKKVLTKKGRDAHKFFFPKEGGTGPMSRYVEE